MMSPKRTSAGYLILDVDWPKHGIRLFHSSETTSARELAGLKALLWELRENGQLEVIRAFQRGDITIAELKQAKRAKRLKADELLVDISLGRSLWGAIESTLPRMGKKPRTRTRYATSLTKLRDVAGDVLAPGRKDAAGRYVGGAAVRDLRLVDWHALAARWPGSASDWNNLRVALSSFLTTYLGDVHHPVRREVMAAKHFPIQPVAERVPDLPIAEFLRLMAFVSEHARPCYWALVLTGMRLDEYLHCTEANLRPGMHAVMVPGTKTEASTDLVRVDAKLWRWIELGIPSPLKYGWIHIYWWRACVAAGLGHYEPVLDAAGAPVMKTVERRVKVPGERKKRRERVQVPKTRYVGLRIHDLRHCLAQWADDAGATEAQIQVALRHADASMTRRYAKRRNKGEVARRVGEAIRSHDPAAASERAATTDERAG